MALFLLVWLVICPLIGKISEVSERYLSNQQALAKLSYREAALKKMQDSYQQIQTDFSRIEKVFLNKEEIVGFITTLETIAQKTGNDFEIKLISSPEAKTGSSNPEQTKESVLAFQITLEGNFSSLLKFSASLENTPYQPYRLINIDNLNVRNMGGGNLGGSGFATKLGELKSILDIKIYTQ